IELRIAAVPGERLAWRETREVKDTREALEEALHELARRAGGMLVHPPGVIHVETDPPESAVELDGEPVGIAPLDLQRPANTEYTIRAVRLGFQPVERTVKLTPDDTLKVLLKLRRALKSGADSPSARIWFSAGMPITQASSTFDTRVSWGGGRSFGASLSFGQSWRICFGTYNFSGLLKNVDESVRLAYGAREDPRADAYVIYSSFLALFGNRRGPRPFLGLGLAAIDREVTLNGPDGVDVTRSSSFEIGWMAHLGLDFKLPKNFNGQLEVIRAVNLSDEKTYKHPDERIDPVWDHAFQAFNGFTTLRLNLGYRF
ncbi:MAG TPA: PEGA domain-containing protein, partial [Bacteroidetes bacterium]|nr:PEGA domain-containing protein [Bacteroidota bacterium]